MTTLKGIVLAGVSGTRLTMTMAGSKQRIVKEVDELVANSLPELQSLISQIYAN